MRVAAWVPSSCFSDPTKTVKSLQAARVRVANLMINNASEARGSTPFTTFSIDSINRMAAACGDAGIEVHLTFWAMPHEEYVDGALAVIPGLMRSTGATMLWLDAEGPWCDATGDFDYELAAERMIGLFPRLALSGIGAALSELCVLAKICCVWSPQAYATEESDASPPDVVEYSLGRWREKYGEPEEGWSVGLAGYKQSDDAVTTMQPPIDDVMAARIRRVCYWTINSIDDDQDVVGFVANLADVRILPPARPPRPVPAVAVGIMPTLDILLMPRVEDHNVLIVQTLLRYVYGVDVGELDGIPGPKTDAGVVEFQGMRRLPETGVVDPNTWHALLSKAPPPQ